MSKKVLVIGESCKDVYIYGTVERFAPEAPAPVFLEMIRNDSPGMASNVTRNLISLGVDCDILTNPNWENITKTRYMDDRTNHMFIRVDTNDASYGKLDIDSAMKTLHDFDAVIISDYDKGFLSKEDIQKIGSSHPMVLLDTKKVLGEWCESVKYIKINGTEYEKSKHTISQKMLDKLIVTRGKEGCIFRNKVFKVKSVSIKDVSGAGDTFIAALTTKLANGESIENAIEFANKCATVVVQKRGVSIVNDNLDQRLL